MMRLMYEKFLEKYTPEEILDCLSRFLTDSRKEKISSILNQRISSVQIALESPVDIHNALAVVRSAEGLGVTNVHVIASRFKKSKGKNTTQGAHLWTDVFYHKTFTDFTKSSSFKVAAATLDTTNTLEDLPIDENICFLLGNELNGLSDEACQRADYRFKLPMFGFTQSFNLSVSAGIILYQFLQRKRKHLKKAGDLSEEKLLIEKAWYTILSLGIQKSDMILKKLKPISS